MQVNEDMLFESIKFPEPGEEWLTAKAIGLCHSGKMLYIVCQLQQAIATVYDLFLLAITHIIIWLD